MGLKWGIFWRMRHLVIETNETVLEIHKTLSNCVLTKLQEHDERLDGVDKKLDAIVEKLIPRP